MSAAVYESPLVVDKSDSENFDSQNVDTLEELERVQEIDECSAHQVTDLEEDKWDQSETTEQEVEDFSEKDIHPNNLYDKRENEPIEWLEKSDDEDDSQSIDVLEEEEPLKLEADDNQTLSEDQSANENESTLSEVAMPEEDIDEGNAASYADDNEDNNARRDSVDVSVYMDIKLDVEAQEETPIEDQEIPVPSTGTEELDFEKSEQAAAENNSPEGSLEDAQMTYPIQPDDMMANDEQTHEGQNNIGYESSDEKSTSETTPSMSTGQKSAVIVPSHQDEDDEGEFHGYDAFSIQKGVIRKKESEQNAHLSEHEDAVAEEKFEEVQAQNHKLPYEEEQLETKHLKAEEENNKLETVVDGRVGSETEELDEISKEAVKKSSIIQREEVEKMSEEKVPEEQPIPERKISRTIKVEYDVESEAEVVLKKIEKSELEQAEMENVVEEEEHEEFKEITEPQQLPARKSSQLSTPATTETGEEKILKEPADEAIEKDVGEKEEITTEKIEEKIIEHETEKTSVTPIEEKVEEVLEEKLEAEEAKLVLEEQIEPPKSVEETIEAEEAKLELVEETEPPKSVEEKADRSKEAELLVTAEEKAPEPEIIREQKADEVTVPKVPQTESKTPEYTHREVTVEKRESRAWNQPYKQYYPPYDRWGQTSISTSSLTSSYYSDVHPKSSAHYTSVFDDHVSTGPFARSDYATLRRSMSREKLSHRLPRSNSISRFTSYHDYDTTTTTTTPRYLMPSTSFSRFMDYYGRVKDGMKRTFSRESLYTPKTYHHTYNYSHVMQTPTYSSYGYSYGTTPRRNAYRTYSYANVGKSSYSTPSYYSTVTKPFISRVSSYYSRLTSGYGRDRLFNPFERIKKLYRPWKFDHVKRIAAPRLLSSSQLPTPTLNEGTVVHTSTYKQPVKND